MQCIQCIHCIHCIQGYIVCILSIVCSVTPNGSQLYIAHLKESKPLVCGSIPGWALKIGFSPAKSMFKIPAPAIIKTSHSSEMHLMHQ